MCKGIAFDADQKVEDLMTLHALSEPEKSPQEGLVRHINEDPFTQDWFARRRATG
jgi:hypothetical protein